MAEAMDEPEQFPRQPENEPPVVLDNADHAEPRPAPANPAVDNPNLAEPRPAPANAVGDLENLRAQYEELRKTVDTLTTNSVPSLLKRLMSFASRPITEFNKYEALELMEALKNAARDSHHEKENYFRLAFETLRAKTDCSNTQFRNLLLPLLGDKDLAKVLDVVAKVEKREARMETRESPTSTSTNQFGGTRRWVPYSNSTRGRCFNCGAFGHYQAYCRRRRSRPSWTSRREQSKSDNGQRPGSTT